MSTSNYHSTSVLATSVFNYGRLLEFYCIMTYYYTQYNSFSNPQSLIYFMFQNLEHIDPHNGLFSS